MREKLAAKTETERVIASLLQSCYTAAIRFCGQSRGRLPGCQLFVLWLRYIGKKGNDMAAERANKIKKGPRSQYYEITALKFA